LLRTRRQRPSRRRAAHQLDEFPPSLVPPVRTTPVQSLEPSILRQGGESEIGHNRPLTDQVPTSELGVRRDKAALSSRCESHPANAPAGSNRSSYGGNEVAEAFGKRVTNW
jgi:hypothetical protein